MSLQSAAAEPESVKGVDRIFVTVGTDYHRFDRLIDWVDEWLATEPKVDSVIVQRGTSSESKSAESVDYLQRTRLIEEFQQASVVVCHGGPATILECRSNGMVPIVVPREARYDEHVNDHQVDFAKRLAAHGDIQLARDKDGFFTLLDAAIARGSSLPAVDDGHAEIAIANFESSMIDLIGERAASRNSELADVVPLRDDLKQIPVVFIGAVPRSGSTVISDLLDENPHMVNIGELVHLWERGVIEDNLCGCGEAFSECEFWSAVGQVAFGGWEQISGERMRKLQMRADRTRHIPSLLVPQISQFLNANTTQYGSVVSRILRAVVEVSGSPIVVDTSKHVSTALLLRRIPDVDLRIVHVVRDPRGVAYSWSKIVDRPEVTAGEQQMVTLHPARIGLRWLWFNWAFSNMDRLGVPVTSVRYEDFVSSPTEVLDQIFAFAGVEPMAAEVLETGEPVILEPGHSVAGNPRRLERKALQIRADDGWKSGLDKDHASLVRRITRPLLSRYRYSKESS